MFLGLVSQAFRRRFSPVAAFLPAQYLRVLNPRLVHERVRCALCNARAANTFKMSESDPLTYGKRMEGLPLGRGRDSPSVSVLFGPSFGPGDGCSLAVNRARSCSARHVFESRRLVEVGILPRMGLAVRMTEWAIGDEVTKVVQLAAVSAAARRHDRSRTIRRGCSCSPWPTTWRTSRDGSRCPVIGR